MRRFILLGIFALIAGFYVDPGEADSVVWILLGLILVVLGLLWSQKVWSKYGSY